MRGVSVAMAASSGPPRAPVTASERPARGRASLRGPSRPGSWSLNDVEIGLRRGPDPQPESRRAVGCVVERTLGRAAMT